MGNKHVEDLIKSGQQEVKIGLVIDDYKLPNKADYWRKFLNTMPEFEKTYELVREEVGAGVTKSTVMCYRFYKLRELI